MVGTPGFGRGVVGLSLVDVGGLGGEESVPEERGDVLGSLCHNTVDSERGNVGDALSSPPVSRSPKVPDVGEVEEVIQPLAARLSEGDSKGFRRLTAVLL